jgi:hypothetical protein
VTSQNILTIALRAEIKKLREENKALTLYCSKVGCPGDVPACRR